MRWCDVMMIPIGMPKCGRLGFEDVNVQRMDAVLCYASLLRWRCGLVR
jgi:hypothetical protein